MRFPVLLSMLLAVLVMATTGRAHAEAAIGDFSADTPIDFLCEHAPKGSVEPVPPPFNFWVVLVCGKQSQALVPVEGMKWFAHGTDEPISILALPPGASAGSTAEDENYVPGYRVRFKSLFAAEVTGNKRQRIETMLHEHLARDASPPQLPRIDHVFQLDAVSIIYDMRYNIYFYISGLTPVEAIACVDECKQTMFFDIVTDETTDKSPPASPLPPGQTDQ